MSARWWKEKQSNLSKRQRQLIKDLFPLYGIVLQYGKPLDPSDASIFPPRETSGKVILDIGFGLGDSLLHFASSRKDDNVIGIELLQAGIAQALEQIHEQRLKNVKIVRCDVTLLFSQNLIDACVDETFILFPDPWPNVARDAQRRVIRPDTLDLLERKMKKGGKLSIVTDVYEYAEYVCCLLQERGRWALLSSTVSEPLLSGENRTLNFPETKYETKAKELGHNVYSLVYKLTNSVQ